ncbi:MAG: DUF4838 domain-containing protein [Xanthomonadales bacterium]|nr:DUF4838 domain-containing protein [Xanthomonadales bacterium]
MEQPFRANFVVTILCIALGILSWTAPLRSETSVPLIVDRQSDFVIYAGSNPDVGTLFAVTELQDYLERITGYRLVVVATMPMDRPVIGVGADAAKQLGVEVTNFTDLEDGFVQIVGAKLIVLMGNSRRSTLYAVYDLLETVGCRWFAPRYQFYDGTAEFVPSVSSVSLEVGQKTDKPAMRFRYKRVEEGLSHDGTNLVQLVDWMAKTRHNALNIPIDYAQAGRSSWDLWRDELIPELQKRGILIDVGGHGYQNFLPPDVYADIHPDWYGMLDGKRQPDMEKVNFNTANPDAVKMLIENARKFLRAHSEIDILTLLPPDTAQWDTSPESQRLGTVASRHARLVSEIVDALDDEFPNLRYLVHAYQGMIIPPKDTTLPPNVLVSLAPIRRQDSVPILSISEQKNLYYLNFLWQWIDAGYDNVLGFGPYYSRYAWRSLPVLQPRLIAEDTKYMALNGVQMGGSFSEPGNWFSYEINHYVYGKMMWNPKASIDAIMQDYASLRFHAAGEKMLDLIFLLESFAGDVTRSYANYRTFTSDVPFPEMKTQDFFIDPLTGYRRHMALSKALLDEARLISQNDEEVTARLNKWSVMLKYLELEIEAKALAGALAGPSPSVQNLRELQYTYESMDNLLTTHAGTGLFLTQDARSSYAVEPSISPIRQ